MKRIFVISLLLFCFCSAQPGINIGQIETDARVNVIEMGERVFFIEFPFSFRYTGSDKSELPAMFDYYYSGNYAKRIPAAKYYPVGWQGRSTVCLKVDGQYEEYIRARAQQVLESEKELELVVNIRHYIDSTEATQSQLKPYLDKMRELEVTEMKIGTLSEFTAAHPDLTTLILSGDSIRFRISDSDSGVRDIIDLPIKTSF